MQKVNLLQGIKKPTILFSARHMLLAVSLSIVVLAIISGSLLSVYGWAYYDYQALVEKQKKEAAAFQLFAIKNPIIASEKKLEAAVATLTKQFSRRKKAFDFVTQARLRQGFSGYMRAFSRYVPPSVSLTHIYVDQVSGNIDLKGKALQPVAVSQMIDLLYKSGLFKKHHFKLYDLEETTQIVNFEIATKSFHFQDEQADSAEENEGVSTKAAAKKIVSQKPLKRKTDKSKSGDDTGGIAMEDLLK